MDGGQLDNGKFIYTFGDRTITSVEEMRRLFNLTDYLVVEEVHSNGIEVIEDFSNYCSGSVIKGVDGVITQLKKVALFLHTADCVPLFLYDPIKGVVGAVHAGRKGSELNIVDKAIAIFHDRYNSDLKTVIAIAGPSICKNCYQIDKEKDLHFDLKGRTKQQLLGSGVIDKNIHISELCTCCNANKEFWSYRKEKVDNRNFSFAELIK